jgi:hypothetical protein
MRRSSLPLALFAGAALLGCPRRPPPPPPDACPTAPGVVLILEARPDASPEGRVSFSVTGVRKIAPHAIPETVTIEGRSADDPRIADADAARARSEQRRERRVVVAVGVAGARCATRRGRGVGARIAADGADSSTARGNRERGRGDEAKAKSELWQAVIEHRVHGLCVEGGVGRVKRPAAGCPSDERRPQLHPERVRVADCAAARQRRAWPHYLVSSFPPTVSGVTAVEPRRGV